MSYKMSVVHVYDVVFGRGETIFSSYSCFMNYIHCTIRNSSEKPDEWTITLYQTVIIPYRFVADWTLTQHSVQSRLDFIHVCSIIYRYLYIYKVHVLLTTFFPTITYYSSSGSLAVETIFHGLQFVARPLFYARPKFRTIPLCGQVITANSLRSL